ncbi:hypothetical protein L1987_54398 [Smallanthus sonchifolius]|uniref:Uncharacterized protein n=1 Tax=Smallanthus sonchifolius TaxID=185202 RepID=A0ACB9E7B1_9ASTR|nr:hypothetical protein L1987_54398 [Smallanthus sonchifolius]
MNEYEEGAGDEECANDHEEPNPDVSFETVQGAGFTGENTPWDRLFAEAVGPSHRPLMVEFLSTFCFAPRPADQPNSDTEDPNDEPPPPEISFCLFGQQQNMSLHRFAVVSGIYRLPETVTDIYTTAISSMADDVLLAW